jgi:hypothetical protein
MVKGGYIMVSIGNSTSEQAKNSRAVSGETKPGGEIRNPIVKELQSGMSPAEGSAKSPQRAGLIDAKV